MFRICQTVCVNTDRSSVDIFVPPMHRPMAILLWDLRDLSIYPDMLTSSNGNTFHVSGLCEGIPPVTVRFPSQRPVARSFDVFFHVRQNKRLRK